MKWFNLWHTLELVAAEVQGVQLVKEGERREGVDLVGVEDEAAEAGTAKDRRQRGEAVSRQVEVVEAAHAGKEPVEIETRFIQFLPIRLTIAGTTTLKEYPLIKGVHT